MAEKEDKSVEKKIQQMQLMEQNLQNLLMQRQQFQSQLMEIESALVSCTELVAEAAVVGRPDDTTGEAICAFVVLKRPLPTGDEGKAIAKQLRDHIAKEIGPIAKPKDIRFGENLPKTRSGKIMRRLLRNLAAGQEISGDTSTLQDRSVLDKLREGA